MWTQSKGTQYIYKYINNNVPYYFLKNLQGDVVSIVNAAGVLVVEYTYDAWGKLLSTTGTLASTIGTYNPFRYRGYYYDSETGWYYLQSRYYDPTVGRFLNADSIATSIGGSTKGYNLYAYCVNNPVNMVDSYGNWPKWVENAAQSVKKAVEKVKAVVEEFFDPNTYMVSGNYDTEYFDASGSALLGYADCNLGTSIDKDSKEKTGRFSHGADATLSVGHAEGEVAFGKKDKIALAITGEADALTVGGGIGVECEEGAGIGAGVGASVLTGEVSLELYICDKSVSVGVCGDLLSVSGEAMYGYFPDEGYKGKSKFGAGLYGYGLMFGFDIF